jgi:hypothetical protein
MGSGDYYENKVFVKIAIDKFEYLVQDAAENHILRKSPLLTSVVLQKVDKNSFESDDENQMGSSSSPLWP